MKSSTAPRVSHPIFARGFDRTAYKLEERGQRERRQQLLAGLEGRVLELGAGNGLNFPYYPQSVAEVVAVEPEAFLRERALDATARATVDVTVVDGVGEAIPVADESVDAAVTSLVLCSVRDQERTLGELRRVIRPGGELRFYEHVRARQPLAVKGQRAFDLAWPLLAGGCHSGRDTLAAIVDAGFDVERCERFLFKPFPLALPTAPHVLGVARRP